MEQQSQVIAETLGTGVHDLSMLSLFLRADIVVQLVMIALLVASLWCWAIIIEKLRRFRRLTAQADDFENEFWSGGNLDDLYESVSLEPTHPMALLFSSAMREWRRSTDKGVRRGGFAGLQTRINQVMRVTIDRELERLERYMGFLATVGSTAPFVGLFGTVWGIMNSFQSIAATKSTSLAVVAPGIAEALFATALGLVAAIPAVVAYNKFSNDLGRYATRLEGFANEFSAIMSRQLEDD
ncbi:protein TolQ [Oceanibacterium hippocampi]|uniref:Tol-Pal system protein TolQ n=1 Tax=Oceanibacterium hippocampi TaxID=745714 RepID=A0A1Y5U0R9_9PROT|nr:protein TolQ [Oceanibacterium hippocampi]SLN73358.1 Biopolymer transport protein ExbB [Oceanibacterium hippocampi]